MAGQIGEILITKIFFKHSLKITKTKLLVLQSTSQITYQQTSLDLVP